MYSTLTSQFSIEKENEPWKMGKKMVLFTLYLILIKAKLMQGYL